jgi:hypothetical protein
LIDPGKLSGDRPPAEQRDVDLIKNAVRQKNIIAFLGWKVQTRMRMQTAGGHIPNQGGMPGVTVLAENNAAISEAYAHLPLPVSVIAAHSITASKRCT